MAERPPLFALRRCLLLGVAVILSAFLVQNAPAADPARIAIALPLSGPHEAVGRQVRVAAELALLDYAARTATNSRSFELTWHDDRCSSEGGLAVAKLVTARPEILPFAVIGHACTSAAQAAASLYASAGVIFIQAGALVARTPTARRYGPRHFRLPAEGSQGVLIGNALLEAGPDARIALVRDRTQYAISALQAVSAILTAHGRSVALVETYAGAEKDFVAIAQRISVANITHVAISAFPSEAVLLVAEVRKASPNITILATDQLADSEFARGANATAEGVRVALPPDFLGTPAGRNVAQRLQANGGSASRTALATYAAIETITAAADTSTPNDVDQTAQTLNSKSFDTILGLINFDANGGANLPSHAFFTWKAGKLVPP